LNFGYFFPILFIVLGWIVLQNEGIMIENLQKNIRKRLGQTNWSVHAFEKKAGLKPSSIQNILLGRSKRPGIDVVHAIAQELDCTMEELLASAESLENGNQKRDSYPEFLSLALFRQVVAIAADLLSQKQPTIEQDVLFSVIEEVYMYSIKNGLDQPDPSFVKWFIDFINIDKK